MFFYDLHEVIYGEVDILRAVTVDDGEEVSSFFCMTNIEF